MRLLVESIVRWLRPKVPADGNWHWYETPDGPIMRRIIDGKTEDRRMTPEEMQEYMASRGGW